LNSPSQKEEINHKEKEKAESKKRTERQKKQEISAKATLGVPILKTGEAQICREKNLKTALFV